ncbi:MAG TPA: tRNA (adenosine(37)-N6)-threonylcarbamoyltransferase complex ATPase subunit type 1 TsaE [Chitinispirillaceae bacterium]|nr:tRNA (adenosine(37)-N6)-threonylcarbamoyltransferase complex ATPase subunit type 1 TsaE [Chitinispirillaceae bacterium]
MQIHTSTVEQTRNVGARLAQRVKPGDVFILDGDLGTGKTEFVRGFVASLGDNVTVRSPSFSILNIYLTATINIYHFDFYRLSDASELSQLGFDDYLYGNGVCLIEWGSLFRDMLPERSRIIKFIDTGESERVLEADFEF